MKKYFCGLLVCSILLANSLSGCQSNQNVDVSALSLDEAYAYAAQQYADDPKTHRDVGDLQSETQQIIMMDGKYYQSYVSQNVDIRYVFISQPEFPDEQTALWDWYTVGTANSYSIELLGKIDDGGKS